MLQGGAYARAMESGLWLPERRTVRPRIVLRRRRLPEFSGLRIAFPSIAEIQPSSTTSSGSTHAIAFPTSTAVAAGDLILFFIGTDSAVTDVTFPSPLVELKDAGVGFGSITARIAIAALVASGGETTVNVTFNTNERHSSFTAKILAANWYGSIADGISISTGVGAGSGSPDPDAVTAPWGSDDNLFIATGAWDNSGGGNGVTGWPTNYAGNQTQSPDISSAGRVAIATRELASASDNPSAFTISSDENWGGTLVIRPKASSSAKPWLYRSHTQTVVM